MDRATYWRNAIGSKLSTDILALVEDGTPLHEATMKGVDGADKYVRDEINRNPAYEEKHILKGYEQLTEIAKIMSGQ